MATNIVAFGLPDPKPRARQVKDAFRAAYDRLQEDCRRTGMDIHGASALGDVFHRAHRMADFWERRAERLERVFRWLMASDHLTDEQRQDIAAVLMGKQATGRDPKMLTDFEAVLLTHYRAVGAADKQMLRTLVARLYGEAPSPRGRGRATSDEGEGA